MNQATPRLRNGDALALAQVPCPAPSDFREYLLQACERGARLAALFGEYPADGRTRLFAVLARDTDGELDILSTTVSGGYPALTPACTQAHWFERELAEHR